MKAKKIYLIGSGKGGVGKSTITVNLAVALAKEGERVGLLDADLYGPSIPIMMGLNNLSPPLNEEQRVIPFAKFGIHLISIGFFIDESRSVVWRGPMLHKMLERLVTEVDWPELDILLIDLPPGTGDVPLSLSKLLRISGGLIVSTQQLVSIADAVKAINAFDQLNIPLLGLIENMVRPGYSEERLSQIARSLSVPLLARIPWNEAICENSDRGIPEALHSQTFHELAENFQKEIYNPYLGGVGAW